MTNFEKCCEWLKNLDIVAYELYRKHAYVDFVNKTSLENSIAYAFDWYEVGNGFEHWEQLHYRWFEYLQSNPKDIIDNKSIKPPHYNENKDHDVYSFVHHNQLGMLEGNVIKYVARHKKKNGKEDLLKAIETLNRLIELEY